MAIKFVDKEPEGEGKPKRSERADMSPPMNESEGERPNIPPLPYAKPA